MRDGGLSPIVFGRARGDLFGFFHAPRGAATRGVGVVLCNPLGFDAMCTHRTYAALARHLAAGGFPALRFDYHGTGDSSGDPHEPGRVRAWIESVGEAIDELRARAGVRAVALFGVRFGATLAAAAAAERGGVDRLVLWAPHTSGRVYARELRAVNAISRGTAPWWRDTDGEITTYLHDPSTMDGISALEPFARGARLAQRALIVARDVPSGEAPLAEQLRAAGTCVEIVPSAGYPHMMRDPQDRSVPAPVFDAIRTWLAREPPEVALEPGSGSARASHLRAGAVREEALFFGQGDRLFGITSEPVPRADAAARPTILFLSAGPNHRVGPNRMYVALVRDLAARGYRGLRFDVGGLGDSLLAPGEGARSLYARVSVDDVRAAMDALGRRHGADRFVVVGLCSGAYLGFHAAVSDPRVVGQVLLNPEAFAWREGDSVEEAMRTSFRSSRYYRRALLEPRVWRRVARGGVNVAGIARVLGTRTLARAKSTLARLYGAPADTETASAFVALSERGVSSLVVLSFEDAGIDELERHLGPNARRMRGRANFRLEIIDDADHVFTRVGAQRALHDLVTAYIAETFP
jgi:pimeloyl-ACP methyl ester carboxylesterase